jgi:succinate dehydrogenase / fumarate reductase iron-sulfur subunit
MAHHHQGYAGPAALNRAFTLLADSRDGLFDARLDRALESCYQCRSEFNCTEVCPKSISPTRAIRYIQRVTPPARTSVAPSGGTANWASSDAPVTAASSTAMAP